jgi:hypothetical protein
MKKRITLTIIVSEEQFKQLDKHAEDKDMTVEQWMDNTISDQVYEITGESCDSLTDTTDTI